MLIPIVIGASAVWAGLLALGNVRSRLAEIGILRTLGVRSAKVLTIFLTRAVLSDWRAAARLCGRMAGKLAGRESPFARRAAGAEFSPLLCSAVLLVVPLFSALVAALPAMWAAGLDPVESLKET